MEPTTDRQAGPNAGRLFYSHAHERLRILGEIPVRKFGAQGKQPVDPDGNPDTSFLANERANAHMAIGAVLICAGGSALIGVLTFWPYIWR